MTGNDHDPAQPLQNAKHEKFARLVADGYCATDAYEMVGYRRNKSHASRLVTNGNVSARIAWYRSQAAEKATDDLGITRTWVLGKLKALVEKALDPEEDRAATLAQGRLAVMDIAKIEGYIVDRTKDESDNWTEIVRKMRGVE